MGPHRFLTDSLDPLPVARHASAKMYADDECERFDWDEYGKKMHELAREATSASLLGADETLSSWYGPETPISEDLEEAGGPEVSVGRVKNETREAIGLFE